MYVMPINLHHPIDSGGEIGVWDIEEPEEWFLSQLDLKADEKAQFQPLKGRRRVEWLAARQLIHIMSGRESRAPFKKDEFGKPYLEGSPYQISISHSHQKAAAIAAPEVVGIDIQHWVPKIERLAKRFLGESELSYLAEDQATRLFQLHVLWGAKESLYKAYGRRKLDFCQHMVIRSFDTNSTTGVTTGYICKEGFSQQFQLTFHREGAYILVYAKAGASE